VAKYKNYSKIIIFGEEMKGAIFLFAVLAGALIMMGIAVSTTYDFSSDVGINKWAYEGHSYEKPPSDLEIGSSFSSGEYNAIAASDDNRASYSGGGEGSYDFHRFNFRIDEEIAQIKRLHVLHEGYGTQIPGNGVELFIWNYSSNQWESVGYHTNDYDTIIEKSYYHGFSNYINETGFLQLLAITYEEGASCPFYYSYNGSDYVLDGEGLLFSILPWWERDSIVALENLKPYDGKYKIKITEELDETSYLDKISLMVVEHSDGIKVYPDFYNNLHKIKEPIQPIYAIDSDGNDCMNLMKKDDIYWLPMPDFEKLRDEDGDGIIDDYNESDFYKWLVLEYPKPENATHAKLLCRLKEGRFGTVGIWGGISQKAWKK